MNYSPFEEHDNEKPWLASEASGPDEDLVLEPPAGCTMEPEVVPARTNKYLREYQREGVRFLWKRFCLGEGGILGDDMGLGKTIQVIALITAILRKTGTKTDLKKLRKIVKGEIKSNLVLIICPSSVLYNWDEELNTWGHFVVKIFHRQERETTLQMARAGRCEVVITTFDTAREYIDDVNLVDWDLVVVDECHKIKEPSAKITIALKSLRCKVRLGLTGTALQNKYDELWCLLDWANPGCLGSLKHFQHEFSQPMTKGFRLDATKGDLATARERQKRLNCIKNPWIIRRTKDKTISHQLPKKTDQVVFCALSKFQCSVLEAVLAHPDMQLVLSAWERCTCGKKTSRSRCCYKNVQGTRGAKPQALLFQFMHIFLKAANHVALLIPSATASHQQAELGREICQLAFKNHPEFLEPDRRNKFLALSDPIYSGKMQVLAALLEVLEEERAKVLLFSYSTTLLNVLEAFVTSKGYQYRRVDGTTKTSSRTQLVNEFNKTSSIFLFLISTKAGGLGLNITGANVVIIFDPNWNPSHDLQAQDRAYRIGQTRDVRVFRLVSAGCIEEIVYLRQIYKQQMAASSLDGENARRYFLAVQGDSRRRGELFGVKNMFRIRPGGRCLTMDIEKRNRDVENKVKGRSGLNLGIEEFGLREEKREDREVKDEDPYNIGLDQELTIEGVLAGAGVVHTHANKEVVGGSRAEDHMSRCAQNDVALQDDRGIELMPADECNQLKATQAFVEDDEIGEDDDNSYIEEDELGRDLYQPGNMEKIVETDRFKVCYGNTPPEILEEHFEQMATFFNMNQSKLVEKIQSLDFSGKIDLMKRFYSEVPKSESILKSALYDFEQDRREKMLRKISYQNVSLQIETGQTKAKKRGIKSVNGHNFFNISAKSKNETKNKSRKLEKKDELFSDEDDEILDTLVDDAVRNNTGGSKSGSNLTKLQDKGREVYLVIPPKVQEPKTSTILDLSFSDDDEDILNAIEPVKDKEKAVSKKWKDATEVVLNNPTCIIKEEKGSRLLKTSEDALGDKFKKLGSQIKNNKTNIHIKKEVIDHQIENSVVPEKEAPVMKKIPTKPAPVGIFYKRRKDEDIEENKSLSIDDIFDSPSSSINREKSYTKDTSHYTTNKLYKSNDSCRTKSDKTTTEKNRIENVKPTNDISPAMETIDDIFGDSSYKPITFRKKLVKPSKRIETSPVLETLDDIFS